MSSFARRLQIRILRSKNVSEVPILDNVHAVRKDSDLKLPVTRWPFSRTQIAFIGERRVMQGERIKGYEHDCDLLNEA